jgi:hypothetical protein
MIRKIGNLAKHFSTMQKSSPSWYLNSESAINLDVDLMGPVIGYNEPQLMELAGLAVA